MTEPTNTPGSELTLAPEKSLLPMFGERLPVEMQHKLASTPLVTFDDVKAGIASLDPMYRSNFLSLLAKRNPEKIGMEAGERRFAPVQLKMYHGVGEDKTRPPNCPKGGVYASDGRIIMVNRAVKDDNPQFANLPHRIGVSVIGLFRPYVFWPPRDDQGKQILPPNLVDYKAGPICYSQDRLQGSRFGKCGPCPYAPTLFGLNRKENCNEVLRVFVVAHDLSEFFLVEATKGNIRPARKVIEARSQAWADVWHGLFWLEPELTSNASNSWYQWKFGPMTTPEAPNGQMNPESVREFLRLMALQLLAESHYPAMASVYDRQFQPENMKDGQGTQPVDVGAIENAAAGMDYSHNNIDV